MLRQRTSAVVRVVSSHHLLLNICCAVTSLVLLAWLLTSIEKTPLGDISIKVNQVSNLQVDDKITTHNVWRENTQNYNQSSDHTTALQHLLEFMNQPQVVKFLPNITYLELDNLKTSLRILELNNVHIPPWVRATVNNLLHEQSLVRKKRVIDADDDDDDDEKESLEDESRMFSLTVKVPELPNVDIGRILELYNPTSGFNSYERRARKDIINFVRTKTFQFALTKLDTNILYATFHITRGQFLKKLMYFIRQMENLDGDIIKATEILEHCIDNTYDNDMVEQDVLDELDEMDETNGRLIIREELVAVLTNATEDVINAAVDLRKFLRTPDLRFGLLFRGLNYALKELTIEQRLSVVLMRLKTYMKTTLTHSEGRSIDTMLNHLKFDQFKELTTTNAMDVYKSIRNTELPEYLKKGYKNILNIGAIEELSDLNGFSDIDQIFKMGFDNDANIAILLRTLCIQFMMSLPPDRENAKYAQDIYNFLFSGKKNVAIYDAPQLIVNEITTLMRSGNEITPFIASLLEKITSSFEKYGPIFYQDLAGLSAENFGLELLIRSLNLIKMRLPQKELKIWHTIQQILDNLNAKQDYEPTLPSEYNFADEFTIACRLSNIQEQFKVDTISQIILHKNEMQHIFHGMRMLRQFPIKVRVIILLNRIDRMDFPYLTKQFKFQLRSIIKELTGDDEINEVNPFNAQHLNLLFSSAISSIGDIKYQKRFKKIYKFLVKNTQYLNSILRELVIMHDYAPRRQLVMLLREMKTNRLALKIPDDILKATTKGLHMFDSTKIGDEQFIRIQTTLNRVMDRVFSGSGVEHDKVTQQVVEARETLRELYSAGIINFKNLLRDVRLHKYSDRTQFLILLYRTAAIKNLFTDDELYKKYGHAVRTLVHYFGIDLDDIRAEAVDLPEEIEDLLETALPEKMITRAVLRARIVLIKALETNVIDRRIAYDGIQCYARAATPKKKLEYIIRNIWPIRADIPSDVSRAIHLIKEFSEYDVDDDTEHPINIYSFDFQEVFDDVITPNEPQPIIKAKEIMYLDFETNTGRYKLALEDFVRGKKYPIQEIARIIAKSIVEKVKLTRNSDKKVLEAATQIHEFLKRNDLDLERITSIEQLLTGNAQNYVG